MLTPPFDSTPTSWSVVLPHGAAQIYRLETSAAFLTGLEMDVLSADGESEAMQASLALTTDRSVPFLVPSRPRRPNDLFYGIENEQHGTSVLPTALVEVDRAWLTSELGASEVVAGWKLTDARVEIRDFGVGVAQLVWAPEDAKVATSAYLDASISALCSRTADILPPVLERITTEFVTGLREHPARLEPGEVFKRAASTHLPPAGRVLWVSSHCRATSENQRAAAEDLASLLCPNTATFLAHRDHIYAAGVARSVTCSRAGWEWDAGTLTNTLVWQDAWWALYWALDRTLLCLQLDLVAESPSKIRALADRSHVIAAVYERISLYGSRIDTALTSGGSRELAVWQCLADAWDLNFRVACVDRKLAQIQRSYVSALASIQETRAARVSIMIFLFAAFSVVASGVAVVQYAGNERNGSLAFRVAFLLALAAITIAAVGAVFSVRTRTLRARLEARPAGRFGKRSV